MANDQKPPKIRLVSGDAYSVEMELNQLLDDYTAVVWNFLEVASMLRITVVLVHSSVTRQQMLAQAALAPNNRR
jgi:hypothetical protein